MSHKLVSRVVRRRIALVLLGMGVAVLVPAASAAAINGHCRLRLPLKLSAPSREHSARTFKSSPGLVSCTGFLGQWHVAGDRTEAFASGTLKLADKAGGGVKGPGDLLGGHVHIWAQVPRWGWFHASLVTFVSNFWLRPVGDAVKLRGHGHLLPTFKSPAAGAFTTAGLVGFEWGSAVPRIGRMRHGVLTLDFAVNNL